MNPFKWLYDAIPTSGAEKQRKMYIEGIKAISDPEFENSYPSLEKAGFNVSNPALSALEKLEAKFLNRHKTYLGQNNDQLAKLSKRYWLDIKKEIRKIEAIKQG